MLEVGICGVQKYLFYDVPRYILYGLFKRGRASRARHSSATDEKRGGNRAVSVRGEQRRGGAQRRAGPGTGTEEAPENLPYLVI